MGSTLFLFSSLLVLFLGFMRPPTHLQDCLSSLFFPFVRHNYHYCCRFVDCLVLLLPITTFGFFWYWFCTGGQSRFCTCCSVSIVSLFSRFSSVPYFLYIILCLIRERSNASQSSAHYQIPSAAASTVTSAPLCLRHPSKGWNVDAAFQTAAPPSNPESSPHPVSTEKTICNVMPSTAEMVSVTQPYFLPLLPDEVQIHLCACSRSLSMCAHDTLLPSFFFDIDICPKGLLHQHPRSKSFSSIHWHYSATNRKPEAI